MEMNHVEHADIARILQGLYKPEISLIEEAFQELIYFFSDQDIEYIYEALRGRGDFQSIHWLAKYLVSIERPLGFKYLRDLAKDENEYIRSEALRGLARIDIKTRQEIFIELLDSEYEDVAIASAHALGGLISVKAVPGLLACIARTGAGTKVKVEAIKALGVIRDKRALEYLFVMSKSGDKAIKDAAISSIGHFVKHFSIIDIERFVRSQDPDVRDVAYLAASRSRSRLSEYVLARGFAKENSEEKLLKMLLYIRSVNTEILFSAIFLLTLGPNPRGINMMARSVIKRTACPGTIRYLLKMTKSRDNAARISSIELLGQVKRGSVPARVFARIYNKENDPVLKIGALTAIGRSQDSSWMRFLLDVIKQDKDMSYAAATALAYSIKKENISVLDCVFELDAVKYPLPMQALLRFVLRLPADFPISARTKENIAKLSSCQVQQVAYLAIRCLGKFSGGYSVEKLVTGYTESDEHWIRSAYLKSLKEVIENDPVKLEELLGGRLISKKIPFIYYGLFREAVMDSEDFKSLAKKMIKGMRAENGRLMVLLRLQVVKHRQESLDILKSGMLSKDDYYLWMRIINSTDIHRQAGLNIDFMAALFLYAPPEAKIEFLTFFEKIEVVSKAIQDIVFLSRSEEENELIRNRMDSIISAWICRAEAS